MFQSRNRASRPSDIAGLNARTLVWEFQSRNRASRPSDPKSVYRSMKPGKCFNPAIGLPGLLTRPASPGKYSYHNGFNPAIGLPGLLTDDDDKPTKQQQSVSIPQSGFQAF